MAQCVLRIAQLSENCVGVSITRVCFGYLSLCWESSTALCRSDDNVSLLRLFGPVFGIKHRMLYKSDNNGGNSRACCVEEIMTRVCLGCLGLRWESSTECRIGETTKGMS
jgi:hypothetical protein